MSVIEHSRDGLRVSSGCVVPYTLLSELWTEVPHQGKRSPRL